VGSEITPWDWNRILFGEAPPEFLVEVVIRTLIMYLLLLVVVRLMGKRMSGQISITELAVMITLGAIISPAMQLPDRSILFGCIALFVIYLLHWLFNSMSTRFEKIEKLTEGQMTSLVKDGILQVNNMKSVGVSRQELFAQLRKKNIDNLASVQRVYLESCGMFTIFLSNDKKPGLPVFPEKDKHILDFKERVDHGLRACANCGHVQHIRNDDQKCEICNEIFWQEAYM
jgi:uncharacterized membrane protein YcaP (DUF421 family)